MVIEVQADVWKDEEGEGERRGFEEARAWIRRARRLFAVV